MKYLKESIIAIIIGFLLGGAFSVIIGHDELTRLEISQKRLEIQKLQFELAIYREQEKIDAELKF